MAGHYYYDPRPFYGHNTHTSLMPLDELFYGRYESVPYWMDQRMTPGLMFEENFYGPGQNKQMVSRRLPEVMQQQYVPQRPGENNFMAFKRPEVRDDIYTDMYRRSPYNFNYNYGRDGVAMAPIGEMHPQLRGQTQDDTWMHTMSAPGAQRGYGQFPASKGLPEPPPGMPTTRFGNGNGTGNNNEHYGPNCSGDQYRPMEMNMSNQSNINRDNNNINHGSHGNRGVSSTEQHNGSFAHGKSVGQGGKPTMQTTTSKQQAGGNNAKQQRYNNNDSSSSSDSDDDDYTNGGNNSGAKWGTRQSSSVDNKHGLSGKMNSGISHKGSTHGYESNARGVNNFSQSISSNKSTRNSHGSYSSTTTGKHSTGGKQSKISKLLGLRDDTSSSEDEGSYGHSKKASKGSSTGSHQHGSHVTSFQPNYGSSQPKQMQFSSQSKFVELKVPICCDNCERKVRACLRKMDGVESVLCDQWNGKVIVYGNLKADNVLKRVRRVKQTSELWQQAKQQQQQQQQRLY